MSDLAKRTESSLSTSHLGMAAGFEDERLEDVSIPWFTLLQGTSPQIAKKTERIEGAEVGQFCNTLTGELFSPPVEVVFVAFETEYVEWRPNMGGFVDRHHRDSDFVRRVKAESPFPFKTPAGNDLDETVRAYTLLLREDGEVDQVVMSISRTKLKPFKKFRGKLRLRIKGEDGRLYQPDLFQHVVKLSPTDDSSGSNDFLNVGFEKVRLLAKDDPTYLKAREFHQIASRGLVKVEYEEVATDGGKENY